MDVLLGGLDVRGTAGASLDSVLLARLEAASGAALMPPPRNVRQHFAQAVARQATVRCDALKALERSGADVHVSVAELQSLKAAAEIVVAWWLLPLLLPDVGVPLAKRVKWAVGSAANEPDEDANNANNDNDKARRDLRLLAVLNWMRSLFSVPFVQGFAREQHLTDVCAGYLQLCHAPGFWQGSKDELKRVRASFMSLLNALPVDVVLDALLPLATPASPSWVCAGAGALLSQSLLRPNGVAALLTLLLDKPDARGAHGVLDRAAVLVTSVPRSHRADPSTYYRALCKQQLVGCFRSPNEAVRRCVSMCVERLMRQDDVTVCSELLDPIAEPLWHWQAWDERRIDWAVADVALLVLPCGGGGAAAEAFWSWFARRCSRHVFLLACTLSRVAASRLREPVTQLLEAALRLPEPRSTRAMLFSMLLDPALEATDCARQWDWAAGPTGGIVSVARVGAANASRDWEHECATLCRALTRAPRGVIGDLFAEALTGACVTATNARDEARRMCMLRLSMELLESLPDRLLDDAVQVLVVLKALLATCADDELLAMILAVLSAVLQSKKAKFERHHEPLVTDLVPLLEGIHTTAPQLLAQSAALRAAIRDPNAAWRARLSSQRSNNNNDDSDDDDIGGVDRAEAFASALRDMGDPLLPVRAHGLIAMRKLILAKDSVALANLPQLMGALRQALRNDESYVFLGAVQALAALGDVCPHDALPVLVADYHDPSLGEDARLKIGEAAVLIAQRCGETLPVFAPQLMDCFLRGIRDPVAAVRASSLSNIGFMCEILHWALHPYICELVLAVKSVLQSEHDILVRRAAVVVLALVICGLGADVFALVRGQIGDVVRALAALEHDSDDLVRIHAREALAELNEAASQ